MSDILESEFFCSGRLERVLCCGGAREQGREVDLTAAANAAAAANPQGRAFSQVDIR